MAYSVRNVIVGAAALYISTADSTDAGWVTGGTNGPSIPTLSAATPASGAFDASTNWRHGGFTTDGIEVSYEPDYGEIEVDQLLDSAKLFKTSMRVSVNTTFAEATLENLLIVWGQDGNSLHAPTGVDSSGNELDIAAGGLGDEPVERALAFIGPAPRAATGNTKRERLYHARRALSIESSSHTLARSDATVLPVSFRLLPDPSFTGKEYGYIRDRNVTA